jgi:hypothetical protein
MRFLPCVLGAVVCLSGSACHHNHHDDGPPRFEQSCTKSCERVHACDDSIDAEECQQNCVHDYSPYGEHLRKEFLDEVDQCIADARCSDLGVSAFDNSCRRDATERIGANLKAVELCDVVADTLAVCANAVAVTMPSSDACIQGMKIFNDATLKAAADCGEEPCAQLGKCFTSALGFVPPTVAPTSAAP